MANPRDPNFENNVFINCPFDSAYKSLLRPLLFTILYFEYNPRIASETNAGKQRLDMICELIESSRYSIHDLSRIRATKKNEFSRHNMPFELGIDYGSRKFAGKHFAEKKFLVIAEKQYEYIKALSDLSGIDIKSHNNEIDEIIQAVRNWFVDTVGLKNLKPASVVFSDFLAFMGVFDAERKREGFKAKDIYEMPIPEFTLFIKDWLQKKVKPIAPGLGDKAEIKRGRYRYTSSNVPVEYLKASMFKVAGGEIYRDKNGKLTGSILRTPPSHKIGVERDDLASEESVISNKFSKPTTFKLNSKITYLSGEIVLGVCLEQDLEYKVETTLKGYMRGKTFKGKFDSVWESDSPDMNVQTEGTFIVLLG
jgi:hypothetical protein